MIRMSIQKGSIIMAKIISRLTGETLYEDTKANLGGANLYGAKGYCDAGYDSRGYHFFGVQQADGWRVKAGCRWFTIPEAIEHWTVKGNKDALARVAVIQLAALI